MIGYCCLVLYIFGIIKGLHFFPIKWWPNFADIMKKKCATASKKTETITKPKTVYNLDEDLPIFSEVSNVDLQNLNLLITTNIKNLLAPLI